jgi:hypothetical protein
MGMLPRSPSLEELELMSLQSPWKSGRHVVQNEGKESGRILSGELGNTEAEYTFSTKL